LPPPELSFSIIVGNHNGLPFIKGCLDSILKSDYRDFEVILVDSGSTDGSLEYVKREYAMESRLRIINIGRNCGYAELNNIGASVSSKNILIFLDFDTEVDSNWLNALAQAFQNDDSLGVAQPIILDFGHRKVIQTAGMYMLKFCGWSWRWLSDGNYESLKRMIGSNSVEIGIAGGAALAIRREIFNKIGGFDSKFFMYFEENDLCWRTWLSGYKVALIPTSIVYHFGGDMRKFKVRRLEERPRRELHRAIKSFHYIKNSLRMMIKNYNWQNLLRFSLTAIASVFLLGMFELLTEGDAVTMKSLFRALLWNLSNMKDTLNERMFVQKFVRKMSDSYVLNHIARTLPLLAILTRVRRNQCTLALIKKKPFCECGI
jgi:GT2 family glycosyltransferase